MTALSWAQELYNVYERQCGKENQNGAVLLPVSHSTANAQIEVTLRQNGSFVTAKALSKEEGLNTIIPVTEDSGGRTSGICAMPLDDKLIYTAGDYAQYVDKDNKVHFREYLEQLERWHESPYTHPSVDAIYAYLSGGTLMRDLIDCHVLQISEETGKLTEKVSIAGIAQEDAFVRFRVYGDRPETWLDTKLYDSFIAWYASETEGQELCYATGDVKPVTYKHPSKLRNTGDKAKLISANDESGFTYRGRFADKTEAISVSYEFSQKMHNALRWLIQRQSVGAGDILVSSSSPDERKEMKNQAAEKGRRESFQFDSLQLVIWTSALDTNPDILGGAFDEDDWSDWEDDRFAPADDYDSGLDYHNRLRKQIYRRQEPGSKLKFDAGDKVMVMGVDAATTGRLSVVLYEELERSCLLEQLVRWHEETAVLRFSPVQKKSMFNSFSVREIISCAYGLEGGKGFLETKPEIVKENVLRLLPCITQGRNLPADIVRNLFKKASNPLAYNNTFNHMKVLETACGMIRKSNIERNEGVKSMAYDPTITDRSYLFGCLLAIADAAEYAAYEKEDRGKRVTNAKRYWSMFAKRPFITWGIIEEKLRVYMIKLGGKSIRYEKMLNDIMCRFKAGDFESAAPLDASYLLGYHHFNAEIYKEKEEE